MALAGFAFEVFGKVQGVSFRYYTKHKANALGLVGWCRNTDMGTVEGEIQGQRENVQQMKGWLSTTGSPYSRIDQCVFKNEMDDLKELAFKSFHVRH
ncbi:hypothetical protein CLOM_g3293 [Closterium sp. NIES-68]|nr:hypothetical protein CLOM_g3293 [Closterium sp. NIES-68]GJP73087.1 hypothetical protein CLOP_g3836 [Closterium sp. NIES-67]